mgnify:CR=1 FL=1
MSDDLTAAYANIGRFFCAFAELEKAVDATFIKIFKLDGHPNAAVITRAVRFNTRLDFIRHFIAAPRASNDVAFSAQWKNDANAMWDAANDLRCKRNAFAHGILKPMECGKVGVEDRSTNKAPSFDQSGFDDLLEKIKTTAVEFQTFQARLDAKLAHQRSIGVFAGHSFLGDAFFSKE